MPQTQDPRTDPEIRARWEKELDAQYAAIDAAIEACPNCKIAKTFRAKKIAGSRQRYGAESAWASDESAEREMKRATCKNHSHAYHLAYVTSPVSETYWAS